MANAKLQAFYRKAWTAALDRANEQARGYVQSPKKGGKFEKYLAAIPKSFKATLMGTWKPFRRTGRITERGNDHVFRATTGPADYAYLDEQEDVEGMLANSLTAELNASGGDYVKLLLEDYFHGGSKASTGVSRQSGVK